MRLLPSSLTGRLVATAVVLVTLVSVLIAGATTVAISSYLTDRLDSDLQQSHERAIVALRRGLPLEQEQPPAPSGEDAGEYSSEDSGAEGDHRPPEIEDAFGQGVGTVTGYLTSQGAVGNVVRSSGARPELSSRVLGQLESLPTDGREQTVDLRELGEYRLVATDLGQVTVVSGLPTSQGHEIVESLVSWEVLFIIVGVLLAGGAALVLVRRQLGPLREVAGTAHAVAGLPLSSGEIGVTARVPDRLTDERTEVGQVGAALNTLLGHVERSLDDRHRTEQQVRQFVADASHELRTPLATIRGYAELSRRTQPPDAQRLASAMGKVEAETGRMTALVEDLLLLARLDAGRPLERQEVDLTKMALEAVEDARMLAPDHRWVLDLPDDPVTVTGDEQRLHQVLSNLLSNARRHTPAATTVAVRVRRRGGTGSEVAEIGVHDDGPGVSPALLPHLFQRFARGDGARARETGGVGLGLALAAAITSAHGGEVAVTSEPGSTRFTVTLPVTGQVADAGSPRAHVHSRPTG